MRKAVIKGMICVLAAIFLMSGVAAVPMNGEAAAGKIEKAASSQGPQDAMVGVLAVPAQAPTPAQIAASIQKGLNWLVPKQNVVDGSWGTNYQVARTGFIVVKLEDRAFEIGYSSPFDASYTYNTNVQNGLNYIFANAHIISIAGHPAADSDGNGLAIYFGSVVGTRTYETSIAMMAIAASRAPTKVVAFTGSPVDGWTYKEVLQNAVDYLAFGQTDGAPGRGGWDYQENPPLLNETYNRSDNSNTGYAVLGLRYAEAPIYGFACTIPAFVKTELDFWIDYIQNDMDGDLNDGGSGYEAPDGWVNLLKTGNLLFEMAFVGDPVSTPRVQNATGYIQNHWDAANQPPGWKGNPPLIPPHYQAAYCLMRGFESLSITTIAVSGTPVNWFDEMSTAIVDTQVDTTGADFGSWPQDKHGDQMLATVWALLTLEKVAPPPPWYWKAGNFIDYAPNGMPDFGGNCSYSGPASVANSLWWYDSKNEPSPQPPTINNDNYGLVWTMTGMTCFDDHSVINAWYLIDYLSWLMDTTSALGTNVYNMQAGIEEHLINTGYDDDYYELTRPMPEFAWIEEEVERCEDVILLLGFWQESFPGSGVWWRIGGRYVTVAGVNSRDMQLAISDPCCDNARAGGPGRVLPPPGPPLPPNVVPLIHPAQYVSHDIYDVTNSTSPGGLWALENYAVGKNISDCVGKNWGDQVPVGPYDPNLTVHTEIDYAVVVSPEPYWKAGNFTDYAPSGMPDFDQKQDMWKDPLIPPSGGPWSYCGPVSVANSLWWYDSKNEPSPVPPPTINDGYYLVTNFGSPWDDHDPRNVMPLVNDLAWLMDTDGQSSGIPHSGTDVFDMQAGIEQYLDNTGYDDDYYELTMPMPNFSWIEEEVERCEDVILLLGFWQEQEVGPGEWEWKRIGGHYVTAAGVNSDAFQIGISDPYYDNAEAGGPGRVLPAVHLPHPGVHTVHNDTQYVSHDIYNVVPSWSPGGHWALEDYAVDKDISNFVDQNWAPALIPYEGPYEPNLTVHTEIDYAVVVSPCEWGYEIDPSIVRARSCEEFCVNVSAVRYSCNTDAWQVNISFDPSCLEVRSLTVPTTLPNGASPIILEETWDNSLGWLRYEYYVLPGQAMGQTFDSATICFHCKNVTGTCTSYLNFTGGTQAILGTADNLNWDRVVNGTVVCGGYPNLTVAVSPRLGYPTAMGGIAIVYNLSDPLNSGYLMVDPDDLWSNITTWNWDQPLLVGAVDMVPSWGFVTWSGDIGPTYGNLTLDGYTVHLSWVNMSDDRCVAAHFGPLPPELSLNKTSFSFITREGENPDDQYLDISNTGGGLLEYHIDEFDDTEDWMRVIPVGGSLATGEHDSVALSVNVSGLAVGNYTGNFTISAPGSILSETVDVSLQVKPATSIDVMRNLPADALDFDAEYPGMTFDVYVNFTAPEDDFNSIGLTDLAPDGWAVQVNKTWCSPNADEVRVSGNKVEIAWYGVYGNGTNFSALYKVTVPETADPGINEWPVCPDMDEAWLEYYFGEEGPYKSCITGDWQKIVTVPGYIIGETRDVNANLLPDVFVTLRRSASDVNDDESTPDYSIICNNTGDDYWLLATKDRYDDLSTVVVGGKSPHNRNLAQYIDWSTPGLLSAGNVTDFEADYGLVPMACDMSYSLRSVNLWLFWPAVDLDIYGQVINTFGLSVWKAMQSVDSWQCPR